MGNSAHGTGRAVGENRPGRPRDAAIAKTITTVLCCFRHCRVVQAACRRLTAWLATGLSLGLLAAPLAAAPARWAQVTEVAFQHLTQDNGLPNEIATAVAQDGEGFLWIGTLSGLARWDGYRFRVYQASPRNAGALPDNYIQVLHGDSAGRLWIGTSAAGLARYDAAADGFVSYPVGPGGLSHVSVRSVIDDGRDGLWVATDGGLDHLDPSSDRFARDDVGNAALAGLRINALLRDARGGLWAGTSAGLFHRGAASERFVAVPLLPAGALQPELQSLAQDSAGRIWAGTLQHGAFVLAQGAGGQARPVRESQQAGALPEGVAGLEHQQVIAINEVRPGEMWLGTNGQGIVSVDWAARETRRIRNVPSWPLSLPNNALHALYRDRAGLVWAATDRGVSRHDPRQAAILTRFGAAGAGAPAAVRAGTEVSWILPMPNGRVWLGTHKTGIEILDASGVRVGGLRPDPHRPHSALPPGTVYGMDRAGDGSVYIATKSGLYRASADGTHLQRIAWPGRDPATATWAVLVDGDTLWVGGQSDGLWKFDLKSGAATALLRAPGDVLSDQRIVVLARGAGGSLWVGTRYGLNRYDPASGAVQRFLPDASSPRGLSSGFVSALRSDAQGRMWVGTYGGGIDILSLDEQQQIASVTRLGAEQGLPDNNVNALLEDRQGRIWVSTDSGLATIDPASHAIRPLRRAEGVVFPVYWSGSAACTADGELLFGGAGGITIVRPEQLQPWTYRPAVVVTDLQVGGKSVSPAGLGRAVAGRQAEPLAVMADANSLAVEFSAIDYSAPERNRYAYKLEGFDADWVETDAARRLAAYTNLPPGNYRLLLRGSNRDGVWGEQALALPVRVLPAWHQTMWFRAGAVLGVIGLLLAIVQMRTRLLRALQAELQRKVSERTAELEALHKALKEKSSVLERSSITDPLTGLHNRRFLTEHIETDIAGSLRRAQEVRAAGGTPADTDSVFFLIDVDHFKRVNDLHGHAAGDAVLVQFSQRLRSVMRESDHVVRWGGEEFLAVARDTDRAEAEELAERIRSMMADSPFIDDEGRSLALTCSIGFACLPYLPARPHALGWQDVVRLADIALLAAKRAGRDAWVGLHATDAAPHEGLLVSVQTGPEAPLHRGQMRASSNKPAQAVLQALVPQPSSAAAS